MDTMLRIDDSKMQKLDLKPVQIISSWKNRTTKEIKIHQTI